MVESTKVDTSVPGWRSLDAAQHMPACDWVTMLAEQEPSGPGSGIGQSSFCAQQLRGASGVFPSTNAARLPTHNVRMANADARRLTEVRRPV